MTARRQLKSIILSYLFSEDPVPNAVTNLINAYAEIEKSRGETECYSGANAEKQAFAAYHKMYLRLDKNIDAETLIEVFQYPFEIPYDASIPIDLLHEIAKHMAIQDFHTACKLREELGKKSS